jgi:hypothetical protein
MAGRTFKRFGIILTCAALLDPCLTLGAPVAVRYREGLVHGFLVLSSMQGDPVAYGDVAQASRGDRVTTHVIFRFKDGSVQDETTIFSQRGNFRLLSYHLEQKGPSFHYPMDLSIDTSSGQVTVRYKEDNNEKEKVASERMQLPADLANGLLFTMLKNVRAGVSPITLSFIVATPKPRLIKLTITPQGDEGFSIGDWKRTAMHYLIKMEIEGVAGVIAPLLGKKPPDLHVWILEGDAPGLVKFEGPLSVDGPAWRIELTRPLWPSPASEHEISQ